MAENSNAFPRNNRLLSTRDYGFCFKNSRKLYSQHFVIFYCKNNLSIPRLGLAISKKQLKHAVDRNRIKRIIRESFRLHKKDLTPFDITVVLSKEARKASRALVQLDLGNELDKQWKYLKQLSEKQ